jgi:hypothetical protein
MKAYFEALRRREEHYGKIARFAAWATLLMFFIALYLYVRPHANVADSTEALNNAGYQNIEIMGESRFYACETEYYKTAFRARNSNGDVVKGVVCCGLLKSCTIRF